jgi:hypothetical protein
MHKSESRPRIPERTRSVVATGRRARRVAGVLAVSLLGAVGLSACGSGLMGYDLPDRTDPDVQAREAELTPIISASQRGGDCKVRMLGESDDASFVWADCFGASGGISAAMRVEGDDVLQPGDGSQYGDDVRRLFPSGLAHMILDDPDALRN